MSAVEKLLKCIIKEIITKPDEVKLTRKPDFTLTIKPASIKTEDLALVFGSESSISIAAGGTYTVPKGIWLVSLSANTSVEYTPDGGTTWRTLIPAGGGGVVISDGSSVRIRNAGTASETVYLYPLQ